jgi:hypothetical protein
MGERKEVNRESVAEVVSRVVISWRSILQYLGRHESQYQREAK